MPWVDDYKKKLVSAEEAVSSVKSHDRVYISGNAATPFVLMKALASKKDDLENVELVHVLLIGEDPLSKPEMEGHFRHNSLFVGPADRKAINEGRADYIPIFLHQIPNVFVSGQMPIDVALLHLSPPDEHGFMSYGAEILASKAAAEKANIVIVQVNEKMPRVSGPCDGVGDRLVIFLGAPTIAGDGSSHVGGIVDGVDRGIHRPVSIRAEPQRHHLHVPVHSGNAHAVIADRTEES